MKRILMYLLLLIPFIARAQQKISMDINYCQPIMTNYVGYTKFFKDKGKVQINNWALGIKYQVYYDNKFSFKIGMVYKFVDLILKDQVDSVGYKYYTYNGHSTAEHIGMYRYEYDKPDYHNRSNSMGLNFDFDYHFGKKKIHLIGMNMDLYFFEMFKSFYKSKELSEIRKNYNSKDIFLNGLSPLFLYYENKLPRNFFTSAIDLQLYYQYNWNISDNFSLGVRASIGTNLYSDWKQFKKYVWAGFGLNVGFLKNEKVRLNRGKLEED